MVNTEIKVTGTLIKNFFHCKRQAYLYYYGLNFKNEIVKIGEIMHKEQRCKEYIFEKIKIDDIKDGKIIEYKKSSSNFEGSKFQILYYLSYFDRKGIKLKGLIKDLTFNQEYEIELSEDNRKELKNTIDKIKKMLLEEIPQKFDKRKECKKCSFFDYCWVK
jgi:CRISPR-associated exonuclease Cas4